MNRLILLVLIITIALMTAAISYAGEVTLQWDQNNPVPDGYRLFQRIVPGTYDYANVVWEGTETITKITVTDGIKYGFVVRAFKGDVESGDSNEVTFTSEATAPPINYPNRPKQLIINFE